MRRQHSLRRQRMYLRMVTRSVARRRSRVVVALLAVATGATTLAGLSTVCLDVPRQLEREFRSYGANLVVLPADDTTTLGPAVLDAAGEALAGREVVGVAPYRYETLKLNQQPLLAAGTDLAGARAVSPYWHVTGAWPKAPRELLVGQDVAERLALQVGERATLTTAGAGGSSGGQDHQQHDHQKHDHQHGPQGDHQDGAGVFTVAGIIEAGAREDGFIVMADDDLRGLVGGPERFDVVEYSVAASREVLTAAADAISRSVEGASAAPVKRVTESETSVLGTLTVLLLLVSVVVLALTMVSVSTTMIAVVAERRREIGLKKALGAQDRGIVREFLGEGVLIGAVGGLVGALLGFVLADVVSLNVFHRSIAFRPSLVPLTVTASMIVTALACLIPVRRAIDVDPAIVLRGE